MVEVYGIANLGGIRAIKVAAMVLATAVGPHLTGGVDRSGCLFAPSDALAGGAKQLS